MKPGGKLIGHPPALDIVHRFRNEFGMTLRNELLGQPLDILEICNRCYKEKSQKKIKNP